MLWLFLYLAVLSDSFLSPVLADSQSRWRIPNAKPIDEEWAATPELSLPDPIVTVNLSTPYLDGKEYNYRIPAEASLKRSAEEFTIAIIDFDSQPAEQETESTLRRSESVPRHLPVCMSPRRDLSVLDERDNWICRWVVGSWDAVSYRAAISQNQIDAAAVAIGNWMRNNNWERARAIVAGSIREMAVAIISGIVTWFITIKFQVQNPQATDQCGNDVFQELLSQCQAHCQNFGKSIQSGDSRPRCYDRFSEETTQGLDGQNLKNTFKPTLNQGDFKNIGSCTQY